MLGRTVPGRAAVAKQRAPRGAVAGCSIAQASSWAAYPASLNIPRSPAHMRKASRSEICAASPSSSKILSGSCLLIEPNSSPWPGAAFALPEPRERRRVGPRVGIGKREAAQWPGRRRNCAASNLWSFCSGDAAPRQRLSVRRSSNQSFQSFETSIDAASRRRSLWSLASERPERGIKDVERPAHALFEIGRARILVRSAPARTAIAASIRRLRGDRRVGHRALPIFGANPGTPRSADPHLQMVSSAKVMAAPSRLAKAILPSDEKPPAGRSGRVRQRRKTAPACPRRRTLRAAFRWSRGRRARFPSPLSARAEGWPPPRPRDERSRRSARNPAQN